MPDFLGFFPGEGEQPLRLTCHASTVAASLVVPSGHRGGQNVTRINGRLVCPAQYRASKNFAVVTMSDQRKSRRSNCIKLTEKQVASAAARHEILYSGRLGGARAVFAFCDLSGMDLSGRNLSDADFTGAYLEETNFAGARLDSANFFGASLRRANLSGASLRRADLRGVSLRGANLIGADLFEADLREGQIAEQGKKGEMQVLHHDIGPSELPGALLSSANLERASIGGAIAIQADFSDAILKDCRLIRANLRRANLSGANLENADLRGCDLAGANLKGAVLVGTKLEFATLEGADRTGALTEALCGKALADLPQTPEDLLAAHALWANSDGKEGRPADLSGVDMRPLKNLSRAILTALIAPKAVLYGMDLSGARLQGAHLEGADLRCVNFSGADMRGANLRNAKLSKADFRDADLGPLLINNERLLPARLDNADGRYADFRSADLRQAVFGGADLAYADFTGAKLNAADFRGTVLHGVKLSLDATAEAQFDETRYGLAASF
jgi:uncharacterized protein YjbI with pentapeptide repeats